MNMRSLLKLGLGLVVVIAVVGAGYWWYNKAQSPAQANALAVRQLATQTLAAYLTCTPGIKQVVTLANPFTRQAGRPREIYAFEAAGLRGIRQGLGKKAVLCAIEYPSLRADPLSNPAALPMDPTTTTPLSYLMSEDALDVLVYKYPACDGIISLIGVPANLINTAFWRSTNSPKLALLLPDLRMVGNAVAIRTAFKSGKIAAAVINRPGAPPESEPSQSGLTNEFDRRYFLLNPSTIDAVMNNYPQLF